MRRHLRKQLPLLLGLASVLLAGFAGIGYVGYTTVDQPVADQWGCFNEFDQQQSFVVFDASEPRFNEEQGRSLRNYFDQLYEHLGFNERLSVITSEGDQVASVTQPRFHVCGQATSPGQLESIGAAPAQTGYLKKQKQLLYAKIVASELDTMLALEAAQHRRQLYQSPILEMIADLSRPSEIKPGSRIILISDLLQNSDSVRFCRKKGDMPSFHTFKKRPVYRNKLKPESLDGVTVEVLMIQRAGFGDVGLEYCTGEDELMAFWREYFEDNGASVRFIRIRHGVASI